MRRLLPLAVLAVVAAGCGHPATTLTVTTSVTSTTTPTTTAQTTPQTTALRVYFLRDGKVAAAGREVPRTAAVAGAALAELAKGPTAEEAGIGMTSELPAASFTPSIQGGVLDLGTVSAALSHAALAQLVYTLTQFPTVTSVRLNGKSYTRADFEDVTPAILVESPLPFAAVSSPLKASGTANTFEATFEYELQDPAGKVLSHSVETATSGSGTRGTFSFTVPFEAPDGLGSLVVFERSAADGSKIHQIEIPLALAR